MLECFILIKCNVHVTGNSHITARLQTIVLACVLALCWPSYTVPRHDLSNKAGWSGCCCCCCRCAWSGATPLQALPRTAELELKLSQTAPAGVKSTDLTSVTPADFMSASN